MMKLTMGDMLVLLRASAADQDQDQYSIVSCRVVEKDSSADIFVLKRLYDVLRKTYNLVHRRGLFIINTRF